MGQTRASTALYAIARRTIRAPAEPCAMHHALRAMHHASCVMPRASSAMRHWPCAMRHGPCWATLYSACKGPCESSNGPKRTHAKSRRFYLDRIRSRHQPIRTPHGPTGNRYGTDEGPRWANKKSTRVSTEAIRAYEEHTRNPYEPAWGKYGLYMRSHASVLA